MTLHCSKNGRGLFLDAPTIHDTIYTLGACNEAVRWSEDFCSDWRSAWESCPRGDWMVWLAARLNVDHRWVVMAVVWCALEAMRHTKSDQLSRELHDALWAARQWAMGEPVGEGELRAVCGRIANASITASGRELSVWRAVDYAAFSPYATDLPLIASTAVTEAAHAYRSTSRANAKFARTVRHVIPWSMVEEKLITASLVE